ncbi:MAG: histidine--tRNA ligase, partial [Gammaproteobacteria bacterium]|nr:histidine--tRNA ligase [Gammaproteobacteria bacterium]
FKRADRSGASMALVMGENELQSGTASIKPLRGEEPQHSIHVDKLVEWLGEWIKQIRHDAV